MQITYITLILKPYTLIQPFFFFNFSGATLGKGLNRMVATLLGGALGFGVQQFATLPGKTDQPIIIAISLYIIGTKSIN